MRLIGRTGKLVGILCEAKSCCFAYEWSLLLNIDDPDVYDGAPVGVQLVARKYEEEKVWAIAKIVSAALKTAGVV